MHTRLACQLRRKENRHPSGTAKTKNTDANCFSQSANHPDIDKGTGDCHKNFATTVNGAMVKKESFEENSRNENLGEFEGQKTGQRL